jgi:hypothetical protein
MCKLTAYTCVKNELCMVGKLVMRGNRIVIPQSLRSKVLEAVGRKYSGRRWVWMQNVFANRVTVAR